MVAIFRAVDVEDERIVETFVARMDAHFCRPMARIMDMAFAQILLVANQDGNDIIIFKRNQQTGLLTNTGKKIEVDKPVCLKFVAMD